MLQTEQNYERDLGVVADVFVNPLKEQSVIDKELLDRIFPPSLLSLRELSSADSCSHMMLLFTFMVSVFY